MRTSKKNKKHNNKKNILTILGISSLALASTATTIVLSTHIANIKSKQNQKNNYINELFDQVFNKSKLLQSKLMENNELFNKFNDKLSSYKLYNQEVEFKKHFNKKSLKDVEKSLIKVKSILNDFEEQWKAFKLQNFNNNYINLQDLKSKLEKYLEILEKRGHTQLKDELQNLIKDSNNFKDSNLKDFIDSIATKFNNIKDKSYQMFTKEWYQLHEKLRFINNDIFNLQKKLEKWNHKETIDSQLNQVISKVNLISENNYNYSSASTLLEDISNTVKNISEISEKLNYDFEEVYEEFNTFKDKTSNLIKKDEALFGNSNFLDELKSKVNSIINNFSKKENETKKGISRKSVILLQNELKNLIQNFQNSFVNYRKAETDKLLLNIKAKLIGRNHTDIQQEWNLKNEDFKSKKDNYIASNAYISFVNEIKQMEVNSNELDNYLNKVFNGLDIVRNQVKSFLEELKSNGFDDLAKDLENSSLNKILTREQATKDGVTQEKVKNWEKPLKETGKSGYLYQIHWYKLSMYIKNINNYIKKEFDDLSQTDDLKDKVFPNVDKNLNEQKEKIKDFDLLFRKYYKYDNYENYTYNDKAKMKEFFDEILKKIEEIKNERDYLNSKFNYWFNFAEKVVNNKSVYYLEYRLRQKRLNEYEKQLVKAREDLYQYMKDLKKKLVADSDDDGLPFTELKNKVLNYERLVDEAWQVVGI